MSTFGLPDKLGLEALPEQPMNHLQFCLPRHNIAVIGNEGANHPLKNKNDSTEITGNFESLKLPEERIDVASMRIVELSKKLRDYKSKLTVEQNRSKHLTDKFKILELKLAQNEANDPNCVPFVKQRSDGNENDYADQADKLRHKVRKDQAVIASYKNQLRIADSELNLAHRIVELETGQSFTTFSQWFKQTRSMVNESIPELSKIPWKGRHAKITALKARISNLESQLDELKFIHENNYPNDQIAKYDEENTCGATFIGLDIFTGGLDNRTVKVDNETSISTKKSKQNRCKQQLEKENESLKSELQSKQTKIANLNSRLSIMTKEFENLKTQTQTLIEKGANDDELVQSLVDQNRQLQQSVTELSLKLDQFHEDKRMEADRRTSVDQQQRSEIQQLRQILTEKDAQLLEAKRENTELRIRSEPHCTLLEHQKDQISWETMSATSDVMGKQNAKDATENVMINKLLIIERDGLRKLIMSLENRLDELTGENIRLSKENNDYRRQLERIHPTDTNKQPGRQITKQGTERPPCKQDTSTKRDGEPSWQYLCSDEFLKAVLSSTGCTTSTAERTRTQFQFMQTALLSAYNEVNNLRLVIDKVTRARKEDFTILTQVVKDIRDCYAEENN